MVTKTKTKCKRKKVPKRVGNYTVGDFENQPGTVFDMVNISGRHDKKSTPLKPYDVTTLQPYSPKGISSTGLKPYTIPTPYTKRKNIGEYSKKKRNAKRIGNFFNMPRPNPYDVSKIKPYVAPKPIGTYGTTKVIDQDDVPGDYRSLGIHNTFPEAVKHYEAWNKVKPQLHYIISVNTLNGSTYYSVWTKTPKNAKKKGRVQ
jgi:hypothetical protein